MRKTELPAGFAPPGVISDKCPDDGWFPDDRRFRDPPVREAGEPQDYAVGDPKRGQPK